MSICRECDDVVPHSDPSERFGVLCLYLVYIDLSSYNLSRYFCFYIFNLVKVQRITLFSSSMFFAVVKPVSSTSG